jgi:hypothetical protein
MYVLFTKLNKDIEKERKLKLDAEKRFAMMEQQVENLQHKLSSSLEDHDSTSKLLEILEGKLKRSNDTKDALADKLRKEEQRHDAESMELCNLRDEMTKVCEAIIAEKQHSEELEKELDEIRNDHQQLARELQELKQNEKGLKIELEKRTTEKNTLHNELEQLKTDKENMQFQAESKVESLVQQLNELKNEVQTKDQEIADLKRKEDELKTKVSSSTQKYNKELEARKIAADALDKKEIEFSTLNEKRINLQKRLEKESKTAKKVIEEKHRLEELVAKAKLFQQDTDSKLAKKEKEFERVYAKYSIIAEELEKEKHKSERMWEELEETVKLLKQVQADKSSSDKTSKKALEVMEHKYNNKINMLEKKCEYLKKMNDYSTSANRDSSNGEASADQMIMKEQQERLLSLMTDQEMLALALNDVETHLLTKEKELEEANEKIRQMEDLLNNEHKKKTSEIKGQATKKLLTLEKCIDEILLEVSIEGIQPSEMNPREKAMIIVSRIHEQKKELSRLLCERDHLNEEVNRLVTEAAQPQKPEVQIQTIVKECEHKHTDEDYEKLEEKYAQVFEQCQKYKGWVLKFTQNIKDRRSGSDGATDAESDSEDDEEGDEVSVQHTPAHSPATSVITISKISVEDNTSPVQQRDRLNLSQEMSSTSSTPTSITSEEPVKQQRKSKRTFHPSPNISINNEEKSQTYSRLFQRQRKK